MNVADFLQDRNPQWQELEAFLVRLKSIRRKNRLTATEAARVAALYRGACADLALAESYRLPPGVARYLNDLVGRTHNRLYRDRTVTFATWYNLVFAQTPLLLLRDATFWIALFLFWGPFLLCMHLSHTHDGFAEAVIGEEQVAAYEKMFSEPFTHMSVDQRIAMGGFYVYNNAGIGLQCFAFGLLTALGPILIVLSNSIILGTVFGKMIDSPSAPQFFEFVTAHGPFELTAIVMATAAGLRIGHAMVFTGGLRRSDSIRQAAMRAIPVISMATVLFCLAAPIEAFISPNPMELLADFGIPAVAVKRTIAILCTAALLFYIVGLGLRAELLRANDR